MDGVSIIFEEDGSEDCLTKRSSGHSPATVDTHPIGLFRLPRELRDMIYTYALTTNDGLLAHELAGRARMSPVSTAHELTSRIPTATEAQQEFCTINRRLPEYIRLDKQNKDRDTNQLQYVCRQLRHETSGFETCCNDLTFIDIVDADGNKHSSYAQFASFIRLFTPVQCRRMKRITIVDANSTSFTFLNERAPHITAIINTTMRDFCLAFPDATVTIQLWHGPGLRAESHTLEMHLLSMFLRRTSPMPKSKTIHFKGKVLLRYGKLDRFPVYPDNLRIGFKYRLPDEREMARRVPPVFAGWDRVMEVYVEMHRNGI